MVVSSDINHTNLHFRWLRERARITSHIQEWFLVLRTVFFHRLRVPFLKKRYYFDCQKNNNYEILIYYVDASFVQEIWKDTEYRI
jgi:hypothetical protein